MMRWSLVFLLFLLGRQVEQLDGEGSVGGTGEDVGAGSGLAAVEDVEDVLEDGPALGLLEGDGARQAAEGLLSDVDDLGLLLLEADEAQLDHFHTCQHTLADPLLQTAAVGEVLLENKCALSLLDVLDPPAVSRRLHEGADQAGFGCGDLAVRPHLDAVNTDCGVDVDVVQGYLQVFLEVVKLLFGLFCLLFLFTLLGCLLSLLLLILILFLLLLDDLSGCEQILENLSKFGGVVAVVLNLILIRGHVAGGVFIGGEQIQVAKLVLVLRVLLVVLQQDQIALLLHVDAPGVLSAPHCQDCQDKFNGPDHTLADGPLAVHQVGCDFGQALITESADALDLVFLILLEPHGVPRDALDLLIKSMQLADSFDLFHLHILDLGDVFREVALVDGLDVGPIVLDGEFFELGLILVVPCSESAALLLGEGARAGEVVLASVAHLDVLADVVLVGHLGVALHHCELLLVLARGH